jgi:hypothetical protein
MKESTIIAKAIRMFKCDTARISRPCHWMFLIIGTRKHTKDQSSGWYDQDGKRRDFAYTEEKVIASGKTVAKLLESMERYRWALRWETRQRRKRGAQLISPRVSVTDDVTMPLTTLCVASSTA